MSQRRLIKQKVGARYVKEDTNVDRGVLSSPTID
jgi:hypothetical protein